uniref:Uncharacterized protein n=1 Tax=Chromera velia CCMP2878 TaxID=1169474 RepID=A0A0G4HN75_9ALVE|eukprot:Cvel_7607.t1-p1 / transcript=Cvel_7607.t1 / gene=Cvel_7607 / organism=Chromera_velia_CCMP2878 / gene_product=hypothetical protein / transcript_product=hypothetical protein / location=Cvel_scaffold401:28880-30228(-) / protein_length=209 / sequence_SO=supercontig / SO=protein_coding / is_pseudo=false
MQVEAEGVKENRWPSVESDEELERKVAEAVKENFVEVDPDGWWLRCRYCKNPDGTLVQIKVESRWNPKHPLRQHCGVTLESNGVPFLKSNKQNPGAKHKDEMFKKLNPEAAAAVARGGSGQTAITSFFKSIGRSQISTERRPVASAGPGAEASAGPSAVAAVAAASLAVGGDQSSVPCRGVDFCRTFKPTPKKKPPGWTGPQPYAVSRI